MTFGRGFTLIELVIVVAVVAILATIAAPNFMDYLSRSRRADAMIALQRVANEQEQFYFDNNQYTTTISALVPNWCNPSCVSPDGYYDLAVVSASISNFTATAIPVAGGSQDGSGSFRINAAGVKGWDPGQDGTFECDWDDANRAGAGGC